MLDILKDYLCLRNYTYERIDRSIKEIKRQYYIDHFQVKGEKTGNMPFIMMLSTKAGSVDINLTAADTVIIFESD